MHGPYMLRRYCPPTSNRAWVMCPSEHVRTASISTANTLRFSITALRNASRAAGEASWWRAWNSCSRRIWPSFSASVERANGIDAVNVAGGTNAWVAADFPTESGPVGGAAS